ncbi:MAG TPA: molybdate ABC transporter substrate-binding protein [Arachnia sp.]|nr:molybdate ABC transporter substrate-binding protein [Arachnia sp.]
MSRCVALLAAALALVGCGQPSSAGPVVFAASSLSEVLQDVGTEATFSFDGSSGLLDQLAGGAPADVFASADRAVMQRAVDAGLVVDDPVMFATNRLVIAVPRGNPAGVTGFDESLNRGKLVTCAVEVPCGAAARRLADAAGLELRPVSEESGVADVLGKVASGEADAGLVYATDAVASTAVESIEITGAGDEPNTYWVAVVADAPHPDAAGRFIDDLTGPWQEDLRAAGFGPPQ